MDQIGPLRLPVDIVIPRGAKAVIIFAHGGGSSRFSRRNAHVADELNKSGFATILFDLLTEDEARDRRNVFDIPLLGGGVRQAVAFSREHHDLSPLTIGLFGASTGAAAALVAAASLGRDIGAIVARGGRPDLALTVLPEVKAPTLLIVGGGWPGHRNESARP
jgi:predicted alpha/beta-hydrolase family hydrolase